MNAINPVKKKNAKGRVKKVALPQYTVTCELTSGDHRPVVEYFDDLAMARRHADWRHGQPGVMKVELGGPKYDGPLYKQRPEADALGGWLCAALEDPKVSPSMKYDINRWMDSIAWIEEVQ